MFIDDFIGAADPLLPFSFSDLFISLWLLLILAFTCFLLFSELVLKYFAAVVTLVLSRVISVLKLLGMVI